MLHRHSRTIAVFPYAILLYGILIFNGCTGVTKTGLVDISESPVLLFTLKFSNQVSPKFQIDNCKIKIKGTKEVRNFTPGDTDENPFTKYRYFEFWKPDNTVANQFSEFLVGINLPPDRYVIEEISGGASNGIFNGGFNIQFNLAFGLKEGQAIYLGRISAVNRKRRPGEKRAGPVIPLLDQSVSGFSVGTFDVQIEDNLDDDIDLLVKKYGSIKDTRIAKLIFATDFRSSSTKRETPTDTQTKRKAWTVEEVSTFFGVSEKKILQWIENDELKATKIGETWLIPDGEIQRIVNPVSEPTISKKGEKKESKPENLIRLKKLRDIGLLSKEEFEREKAKLDTFHQN